MEIAGMLMHEFEDLKSKLQLLQGNVDSKANQVEEALPGESVLAQKALSHTSAHSLTSDIRIRDEGFNVTATSLQDVKNRLNILMMIVVRAASSQDLASSHITEMLKNMLEEIREPSQADTRGQPSSPGENPDFVSASPIIRPSKQVRREVGESNEPKSCRLKVLSEICEP